MLFDCGKVALAVQAGLRAPLLGGATPQLGRDFRSGLLGCYIAGRAGDPGLYPSGL